MKTSQICFSFGNLLILASIGLMLVALVVTSVPLSNIALTIGVTALTSTVFGLGAYIKEP